MKPSVTLVFFILFLVVGWVFYSLRPVPEDVVQEIKEKEVSLKLLNLEKNDFVNWIQIQNIQENQLVTLELKNDQWMIKYPISASADSFMVNGLVTALTVSKKARNLEKEGEWEEYGLLRPSFKIGVETKKGDRRRYLLLGDEAPVGNHIFARWEDEEEYFLLDMNLKKAFNRSIYSLRSKQIFSIKRQKISKIRFRTFNGEYEIARHDKKWFWMEPIPILGEVIEDNYMDELLVKLEELYVKDFLDEVDKTKRDLGFDLLNPQVKIWQGNEEESITLNLGDEVRTRDSFYGYLEGEENYFFIAKSKLDFLFAVIENLAEKFKNQELSSGSLLTAE